MKWSGLAAGLIVVAAAAWAQDAEPPPEREPIRFFGTAHTYFELNQTEEDSPDGGEYRKLKQILSLNLVWSRLSAGVQGEYLYYSDPDLVDPLDLDRTHKEVELRKYYVEYLQDSYSARLGTFFTSLGRGLTLYVQKNDALGFDEPVHGATGSVNLGPVELTALGGRVSEPLLETRYGRSFDDEVRAGRALVHLPKDLYLAASYVAADLDTATPAYGDDEVDVWAAEAGGYGIFGFLDAHAEWAEMDKVERGRDKEGYGRYLALSSTFGPVTLLGEAKDYWNFAYRYNTPPNAGRPIEPYEHNDVKGARLKADWTILSSGTLLYASIGEFDSHREETSLGGLEGDSQLEWYVGLEETLGLMYAEASYFNRDLEDRGLRQEHVIAEVHLTVAARGDLNGGYDLRDESADYYSLATHRSHLTFSWAPHGSAGVRYAWVEKQGLETEEFWGGELEYLPKPYITVSLFAGNDPGGLVCAGGQCRQEPRFKGFRAQAEWRF